jgi:hypothetical protein
VCSVLFASSGAGGAWQRLLACVDGRRKGRSPRRCPCSFKSNSPIDAGKSSVLSRRNRPARPTLPLMSNEARASKLSNGKTHARNRRKDPAKVRTPFRLPTQTGVRVRGRRRRVLSPSRLPGADRPRRVSNEHARTAAQKRASHAWTRFVRAGRHDRRQRRRRPWFETQNESKPTSKDTLGSDLLINVDEEQFQ